MEFTDIRTSTNSENMKRKEDSEHDTIQSTNLFSAGRFTHSFVVSLGFKTRDVTL
jgi:hypothetical protein